MGDERVSELMDSYYSTDQPGVVDNTPQLLPSSSPHFLELDYFQMSQFELRNFKESVCKEIALLENKLNLVRLDNFLILSQETDRLAIIDWADNAAIHFADCAVRSVSSAQEKMDSFFTHPFDDRAVISRSVIDRFESLEKLASKIRGGNLQESLPVLKQVLRIEENQRANTYEPVKRLLNEFHIIAHELIADELKKISTDFTTYFPKSFIPDLVSFFAQEQARKIKLDSVKAAEQFILDRTLVDDISSIHSLVDGSFELLQWTWPDLTRELSEERLRFRFSVIPSVYFEREFRSMNVDQLDSTDYTVLFTSETIPSRIELEKSAFRNTLGSIMKNFTEKKNTIPECSSQISAVFADHCLSRREIWDGEEDTAIEFFFVCFQESLSHTFSCMNEWERILGLILLEKYFTEKSLPSLRRLASSNMIAEIDSEYSLPLSPLWEMFEKRVENVDPESVDVPAIRNFLKTNFPREEIMNIFP